MFHCLPRGPVPPSLLAAVLLTLASPSLAQLNPTDPENPFRTPGNDPGNNPGNNPSGNPGTKPGTTPGGNPGNNGFPRLRQPGGPGSAPAPRYRSLAHYLLGVWQWRTEQGRLVRASFARTGRFAAASVGTGMVMVGSWRTQGFSLRMVFQMRCRGGSCEKFPTPRTYNLQLRPKTRNQMQAGRYVWRRIR